jgi:hypothetical protein
MRTATLPVRDVALEPVPVSGPPDPAEVDHNLYLDFLSRKLMRAWTEREQTPASTPWTPLRKPLAESTVAFVSSAGIARLGDPAFDQEHERRDPWWGDPSYRLIPRGTRTAEVGPVRRTPERTTASTSGPSTPAIRW